MSARGRLIPVPNLDDRDWQAIRDGMDAASFAGLVRRPGLTGPDAVFSEFGLRSGHPSYMIRTRPWKYVYHQDMGEELDQDRSAPCASQPTGQAGSEGGAGSRRRRRADLQEEL